MIVRAIKPRLKAPNDDRCAHFFARTFGLFFATAVAELIGCYSPLLWLTGKGPAWLLGPAALSLAIFWLAAVAASASKRQGVRDVRSGLHCHSIGLAMDRRRDHAKLERRRRCRFGVVRGRRYCIGKPPCLMRGEHARSAPAWSALMFVTVMNVGIVRVRVPERRVVMKMRVGFSTIPFEVVSVLMMRIMDVLVRVGQRIVDVWVLVRFCKVQPEPPNHQCACGPEDHARDFRKHDQRNRGADERRRRKISTGSRRPKVAQGEHKQDKAQAIAAEANRRGNENGARFRNGKSECDCDGQVDGSGDKSFDTGNLKGIARRYPAGQIIVDSPAKAGPNDCEDAPWHSKDRNLFP